MDIHVTSAKQDESRAVCVSAFGTEGEVLTLIDAVELASLQAEDGKGKRVLEQLWRALADGTGLVATEWPPVRG